jgi:hypothetical protein
MTDMPNNNLSVSQIFKSYRGAKSLRKFAAELSQKLPDHISYQSIKDWEDGRYIPNYYKFGEVARVYDDWRRSFALEIRQALRPNHSDPEI